MSRLAEFLIAVGVAFERLKGWKKPIAVYWDEDRMFRADTGQYLASIGQSVGLFHVLWADSGLLSFSLDRFESKEHAMRYAEATWRRR